MLFWEAAVPRKLRGLAPDGNVPVLQVNFSKAEHAAGARSPGKRGKKNNLEKIMTPEV